MFHLPARAEDNEENLEHSGLLFDWSYPIEQNMNKMSMGFIGPASDG
jgi:hypothetical protein